MHQSIVILGPTASGKTRLAALIAEKINGEIISADSRQVYRGMNLGTGKDYDDYIVDGKMVPYHLTDMLNPGEEYNVFRFRQDFEIAFKAIANRGKTPVVCGGTGLYLEAVLGSYNMLNVPENRMLRQSLSGKSQEELIAYLQTLRPLHNTTDILDRERTLRAVEIALYENENQSDANQIAPLNALITGIAYERQQLRQRITERLKQRLAQGMIAEVENLIRQGTDHQKLEYYGLEYRYLSRYIRGIITREEMFSQLNTAIHQFAKRQMTWFRRMERKGFQIHWLQGELSNEEKIGAILKMFDQAKNK